MEFNMVFITSHRRSMAKLKTSSDKVGMDG